MFKIKKISAALLKKTANLSKKDKAKGTINTENNILEHVLKLLVML